MQFDEDRNSDFLMGAFVMCVLLIILLAGATGSAAVGFLTSRESVMIDHSELGGMLFVDSDQFSRYRDQQPTTIFEPGTGVVSSVVRRGNAQAYLVPSDILYVIRHQTFDPASLAEGVGN